MAEVFEILTERSSWFLGLILEHMLLAGTAILIAGAAGLIIGIFLDRHQKCANVVLGVVSLLYTIPDIAMFGFLIPITGIGGRTAVIALTIYALLPMVRNTYTGLGQVSSSILEAARGMGSTEAQVLFKVKLPMAFSVILAGVRNMVVMTISVAGIASFIGAGGLGKAIYRGISTNNPALMTAGSLLIALLAIFLDLLFGTFEKRVKKRWKM